MSKKMSIYVASSWRNVHQPKVVQRLRVEGFEVYDFRNPPDRIGFSWRQIWGAPTEVEWTAEQLNIILEHPVAQGAFASDANAIRVADAVVLVMPSGRSAHLEAGYAIGAGKPLFVYQSEPAEPELMYKWAAGIYSNLEDVVRELKGLTFDGAIEDYYASLGMNMKAAKWLAGGAKGSPLFSPPKCVPNANQPKDDSDAGE